MTSHPQRQSIDEAAARHQAFIVAIPPALADAEDQLPSVVGSLNAAARSKLQRVYSLADSLSTVREPFVACRAGCAYCCKMNVMITSVEADRLTNASGRRAQPLKSSVSHPEDAFTGKACPFLGPDDKCSVYQNRPLACRTHASFLATDEACHPSVMHKITVPMANFTGLTDALFALSTQKGNLVVADIRDFFPHEASSGHPMG